MTRQQQFEKLVERVEHYNDPTNGDPDDYHRALNELAHYVYVNRRRITIASDAQKKVNRGSKNAEAVEHEWAAYDAHTGEKRQGHTHARCVLMGDSERGHDHYCEVEEEGCDDAYCFGTLADGSRDIRDEIR